jgi:sugar (pentulose or hexulose) kinase
MGEDSDRSNVHTLAIDLGAESGRAMLGHFDGERVSLREVHRFQNDAVRIPTGYHWDVFRLYHEIKIGLAAAAGETGGKIESLGIDTWAVDFGLLDCTGALIGNPYHYRDLRTEGMLERAFSRVPRADIYRATGIQAMPINTLCQLLAMEAQPALQSADTMLLIADLFRYWLSGEQAAEVTIASTTQLYDQASGDWAWDIINRLNIPARIFPAIVPSGQVEARLRPEIAVEAGLHGQPFVIPGASHDTASAVAAVPAMNRGFAYISSGTWSLVGTELASPMLGDAAMDGNFTNEVGVYGTIRFLKNVMGLWLLQQSRQTWVRTGGGIDYETLLGLASVATPLVSIVDPDYHAFLPPGDMPARIAAYCGQTGQVMPREPGATVRCILESLALKYRWVIEQIEKLTGQPIDTIHIVGGGSRNALLCQFTADATRRSVQAGPVEATALGNILVQEMAQNRLGSLTELREVVRRSTHIREYEPMRGRSGWDDAYVRLQQLMERGQHSELMSEGGTPAAFA